jgi:hypothetical protein
MPSLAEQGAMSGQLGQLARVILQPYQKLDVHSKTPEPNALTKLSSPEVETAYAHALRDFAKDFGLMARMVPLLQEYNRAQLVYYYYHVFKASPAYKQFKSDRAVDEGGEFGTVADAAGTAKAAAGSTDTLPLTASSLSSVAVATGATSVSVDVGIGTSGSMMSRAASPGPTVPSARLLLSSKRVRNTGTATPAPPCGVVG